MKSAFILIVVMVLVGGGFFLLKNRLPQESRDRGQQSVATTNVESRDIEFAINVAGEIAPAEQVSVRPEINGRIATLPVDIGDKVKRAQVLFTLDDKELQNRRLASQTDVERARLQLEQSERNFKRSEELYQDKLIPEELYETSKTELFLARNAVERAQRDLAVVDEQLTKTIIKAPFDCTVLTRPISVGQAVSGSGGVGGGTEVLTIADLNQMIINSHVNQADVTRLRVGQEVEVAVEAVPGLKVMALVDRVAPQATIRNSIKGFAARMLLKDIDPRIQPGMTANVTIPVASADNVLAIPLGAVFTEQGERYVYVRNGEKFIRRPVKIGVADYFYAEVVSGLNQGEVVAIEQPPAEAVLLPTEAETAQTAARGEGSGPAGGAGSRTNGLGSKTRPARSGI
jgi:HlyD family secretion protein